MYQAREFYLNETKRMQNDLSRGGRKYDLTMSQEEKMKELEQKIQDLRHKVNQFK